MQQPLTTTGQHSSTSGVREPRQAGCVAAGVVEDASLPGRPISGDTDAAGHEHADHSPESTRARPPGDVGGDDAEIVLDCKGRILSFSASAVVLLGRTVTCAEQVQTIGRLIPVLPLREATAGYNMAYVLFWFGQGQWRECDAVDCEGRSVPVTVTVRRIDGGDEGSYRVLMRQRRALDALNVH